AGRLKRPKAPTPGTRSTPWRCWRSPTTTHDQRKGGSGTMAVMANQSFRPSYISPPGETIADLLDEREMTQTELAKRLGVTLKHVNQAVNGCASISAELALGLERVRRV